MTKNLNLTICSKNLNDISQTLKSCGYNFKSEKSFNDALKNAKKESAIMLISDNYPTPESVISKEQSKIIYNKNLRVYIEYPKEIYEYEFDEPKSIVFERLIVSSDFFKGGLELNSISMINGCFYLKTSAKNYHLGLAKVAGYNKLAYDMPKNIIPILFNHKSNENILISATSLSNFIKARYAPYDNWRNIWNKILSFLLNDEISIEWEPIVRASYKKDEALKTDFEIDAFKRNIEWFHKNAIYSVDKTKSVFEGFESAIDYKGYQLTRNIIRADCLSESSMAIAFDWEINKNPYSKDLAKSILDYALSPKVFYQDEEYSPMYGLINWYENSKVFYGDDNARVILGALAVRSILLDEKWDERILKCTLANLRTSSKYGFRQSAIVEKNFIEQKKNWTDYYNDDFISIAPHYNAYLWAAYLWVYLLTDYEELLIKSKTAIEICMNKNINEWNWQNSLSGEITRMILPLAFLVKAEDNEKNRKMLKDIVYKTIELMDESGAINDLFGDLSKGKYPPPQSNESYGTSEASLLQENGDKATDLLYTTNWAFIGLHEASLILNDKKVNNAVDKLSEFLCRIQLKSSKYDKLDGAWMRSFDYEKWEYYGSSADIGWGAWCIETGWVNSWISTTLALRKQNKSLINLVGRKNFKSIISKASKEMFSDKTDLSKISISQGSNITMPGAE